MALQATTTTEKSTVLPAEEGRALFDREAQRLLAISGADFLRKWDAGEYLDLPDDSYARKVMRVAFLIPFGRPE
jgi:hypothetical protein